MSVTEIRKELYHFIEEGDAKLIKMLHAIEIPVDWNQKYF